MRGMVSNIATVEECVGEVSFSIYSFDIVNACIFQNVCAKNWYNVDQNVFVQFELSLKMSL